MANILVVDDSIFICDMIKNILKPEDIEVTVVQTGAACFAELKKQKADLLLLDIVLPDIDGFEICRRLKADQETKEIPVIFITSMASIDDIVKAFEKGALDYINKPFNQFELKARVFAHLRNKIMSDEMKQLNASLQTALEENKKLLREDSLTKLYNRRYTTEYINSLKNQDNTHGEHYAIMADIDDFKKVNDTYGHNCGDYVICAVADILKEMTGNSGIVSRWGGEEFLILLSTSNKKDVLRIAAGICSAVRSKSFVFDSYAFHCSVTLGLSTMERGMSAERSIAQADEALYRGKQNGKDQFNLY